MMVLMLTWMFDDVDELDHVDDAGGYHDMDNVHAAVMLIIIVLVILVIWTMRTF